MKHKVPVLNLKEQFACLAEQLEDAIMAVLRSGNYILGERGAQLEREIAQLCGCQFGIGVANGTDALELALWSLDIESGDEVITPAFTFAATAEAIVMRGATPVFVEVEASTFNIDASKIEELISERTKAIMPVHLYGMPAKMDEIMALAKKYSLKVIEDNAQAIGAECAGKATGSFGDLACISFYPTKNLGACGDAGMIVTNDAALAERLRKLRAHGMKKRYYHEELGINSRLDELQAAILLTKLPYLSQWNETRAQLAESYDKVLKKFSWLQLPLVTNNFIPSFKHVWHQYTVLVNLASNNASAHEMRDLIMEKLTQQGIGSMCYYPIPIHLQDAFAEFGYSPGDLPITESLAQRVISLPMYPELSQSDIESVAAAFENIEQELMGGAFSASPAFTNIGIA